MPLVERPIDPSTSQDHGRERRTQILRAAMACFARRGFHQTTMNDICAEAQISVGLIYRYFDSKDAVIAYMADEHKADLQRVLARARAAPALFEALEILFTCHCEQAPVDATPQVQASFVVDLFAEAARNPLVGGLVRDVVQFFIDAVTDLIAASGTACRSGLDPRQAAEMIVDTTHGLMIRDITDGTALTPAQLNERQVVVLRRLWSLLFPAALPAAGRE